MMACRFSARDSARRTFRLPSTPLRLDTKNTSVCQPRLWYTLTVLLFLSWSRGESAVGDVISLKRAGQQARCQGGDVRDALEGDLAHERADRGIPVVRVTDRDHAG